MTTATHETAKTEVVLRTLQTADIIGIFTADGVLPLIEAIEREARAFCFDIETEEGRAGIKSLAYNVARAKTRIDDVGKNMVSEWKQKAAVVDKGRRVARERLDALKEEVRQPLTEHEAEVERRVAAEKLAFEIAVAWEVALEEDELRTLRKEKEAIEQLRREAEEADRQAAHEERIRLEAEERGRREAEEKMRHEREASERREADAKAALEKAKVDRILAEQKAERDKLQAVEDERRRAREEKEARDHAEHERIERERRAEDAERIKAERLANHKAHRQKIRREAEASLVETNMMDECAATALIMEIAKGNIRHVRIEY